MKKVLESYAFKYGAIFALYVCMVYSFAPIWDKERIRQIYEKYPQMSLIEINRAIDALFAAVRPGANAVRYYEDVQRVKEIELAWQRFQDETGNRHFEQPALMEYTKAQTRMTNLTAALMREYKRHFTDQQLHDAAGEYYSAHPESLGGRYDRSEVETEHMYHNGRQLWCAWWCSWVFAPFVLFLRFEQFGKSLWYECKHRPHKLLGAWLFIFLAVWKYPNDELQQDLVRAAKWLYWLATSALSWTLMAGSWLLSCGLAKAQTGNENRKREAMGYMVDFRRTDAVTNGPGGLPNTIFAQADHLPRLPKKMVLQNLSVFGKDGYQVDVVAVYNLATPVKGLTVSPAAGFQANANAGVNGVVYGLEAFYKQGRFSLVVPSIWWEKTWGANPAMTFWAVGRPSVRVTKRWSVIGEAGLRTITDKPVYGNVGPGVELKTKRVKLMFYGLWKSSGVWVVRSRFSFAGTY